MRTTRATKGPNVLKFERKPTSAEVQVVADEEAYGRATREQRLKWAVEWFTYLCEQGDPMFDLILEVFQGEGMRHHISHMREALLEGKCKHQKPDPGMFSPEPGPYAPANA